MFYNTTATATESARVDEPAINALRVTGGYRIGHISVPGDGNKQVCIRCDEEAPVGMDRMEFESFTCPEISGIRNIGA